MVVCGARSEHYLDPANRNGGCPQGHGHPRAHRPLLFPRKAVGPCLSTMPHASWRHGKPPYCSTSLRDVRPLARALGGFEGSGSSETQGSLLCARGSPPRPKSGRRKPDDARPSGGAHFDRASCPGGRIRVHRLQVIGHSTNEGVVRRRKLQDATGYPLVDGSKGDEAADEALPAYTA